jgi:hypothetical protein
MYQNCFDTNCLSSGIYIFFLNLSSDIQILLYTRLFLICKIDWLIIYCFTSRSIIFHWYGDVTIAGEGLQNLGRPMLGAQGLWAGRDLYCATPALTRDLDFSGLIRRAAPFSRHARGCGGSLLPRILSGLFIRKKKTTKTQIVLQHVGSSFRR